MEPPENRKMTTMMDLPEEMMLLIFSKVVDLVGQREFRRNVMPVCHAFRDLALGDCRFWTELHGDDDDDIAIFTRSGTLSFVRRLTLDYSSPYLGSSQFFGYLQSLQEIQITNRYLWGDHVLCHVFDKLADAGVKPKSLDIQNLEFDIDSFVNFTRSGCCDNLVNLRLQELEYHQSFLTTTSSCPISEVLTPLIDMLETLELHSVQAYSDIHVGDGGAYVVLDRIIPTLDLNAVVAGGRRRLKSLTLRDVDVSFDPNKNDGRLNLTILVFDRVRFGDVRMKYTCLSWLLGGSNLTDLILRSLRLEPSCGRFTTTPLSDLVCQNCPRLERLEVGLVFEGGGTGCPLRYPLFDVAQVLARCKNIRKIDLGQVMIWDTSDCSSSSLTHLRITEVIELNRLHYDCVAYKDAVNMVRSSWLRTMFSGCSNLRVLDMTKLCMRFDDLDTWTAVITETCGPQLTTLRLDEIGQWGSFIPCLDLDELLRRCTKLRHLSLGHVQIGFPGRGTKKRNSILRRLELTDVDPGELFPLESVLIPLLKTYGSKLEFLKLVNVRSNDEDRVFRKRIVCCCSAEIEIEKM